ncbi:MAG: nucleotidyltransferase domain-containing protein [Thermoplasmatota archaeon]
MAFDATVIEATRSLRGHVLGVMLWGSHAAGTAHGRSDIDVCIVAGPDRDPATVASRAMREVYLGQHEFDIKIFEDLPLYLKGAVIDADRVLWAEDEVQLYEYLRPFRRSWDDQKHRQKVPLADLRSALARG